MPTARPRHTVTENADIAHALDAAAEQWPEDKHSRGRLLVRLLKEGHRALLRSQQDVRVRRSEAVHETSGILTGTYPSDYLAELREDWPE